MIELFSEYIYVRCIWLYALVMSRTPFRVNPHSIVAPASSKEFLDIQATIQASLLALIILPLLFFKFKISCQSHFEILDLLTKLSLEKFCFCENYRFQSAVLVLRMTEVGFIFKERGVRCILFRVLWKKFYEPKFYSKTLNVFSIIGKLRCRVDVNFKPLLKIWICEGVKLTLDKLKTLVCIISSSLGLLLLHTGHGEKNHLLRSYLNFLQLVSNVLRISHSYDMFTLLVIIIGLAFVIILSFYHPCWLCWLLPFRLFSEFILSWDLFFSQTWCIMWRPEEALFR